MPEEYEKLRDRFIANGMPQQAAKQKAARIYNASHPPQPVSRGYYKRKRSK